MNRRIAYRGELWDVPRRAAPDAWDADALRAYPDGVLVVEGQRIVDVGAAAAVAARHPDLDLGPAPGDAAGGSRLILPGFVDAHLHFPQLDMIGASGEQLLGWLQRYTYPEELRFVDPAHATRAAARFVTELLANGTTTAAIYGSSRLDATECLLREVDGRGLRAVVGKVSMDRNAPEPLLSTVARDLADNERLIATWHGRDERLYIALTPRFALSCSEPMLTALGALRRRHPSVYVQTHHAETMAEIAAVRAAFPRDRDYLAVYERFGLVGERAILGHGVHATDAELTRLAGCGGALAHCPTSNLFLGSGLFRLGDALRQELRVGLGSDVGAGTSFSTLRTMSAAYDVQQLRGTPVSPVLLFYLATLGGAEALRMEDRIGNFAPGKRADFVVMDCQRSRLLRERFARTSAPHERLAALLALGDDRLTERVVIDGRVVFAQ